MQATIMRAARKMGTQAEDEAVRRAAKAVVVEAMQVGDMEADLAEIAEAVQAMGWCGAEQAVMAVVQELIGEEGESVSEELQVDLGGFN